MNLLKMNAFKIWLMVCSQTRIGLAFSLLVIESIYMFGLNIGGRSYSQMKTKIEDSISAGKDENFSVMHEFFWEIKYYLNNFSYLLYTVMYQNYFHSSPEVFWKLVLYTTKSLTKLFSGLAFT